MQASATGGYSPGQDALGGSGGGTGSMYRPVNAMNDPRILKGSTWGRDGMGGAGQASAPYGTQARLSALQSTAKSSVGQLMASVPERPQLPCVPVQTAPYLEAYPDKIEELGATTQTDPMAEVREPAPYAAPPQGVDAATQILEGDLFDFDREAQPILDVLVGSVLQQALREYADEEELRLIRAARDRARERRAGELQEVRRLEEAERRRRAEVVARQTEDLRRREVEEAIARKMGAQTFASAYAAELEVDALDAIEARAGFVSPLEAAVSGTFVPQLIKDSIQRSKARRHIHTLLHTIIAEAVQHGVSIESK